MFDMFAVIHWLWTNVFAGLGILAFGAYTVVPRINSRIADTSAAFSDHREFKRRVTTILALCGRLAPELASENPVLAERFASERARWFNLLEEHTIWLADNLEWYALGWPSRSIRGLPSLRDITLGYSAGARSILLSDATEQEKVGRLQELTFQAHMVSCQRRTPRHLARLADELTALRKSLIDLGSWQGPMPQASAQAAPSPAPPVELQPTGEQPSSQGQRRPV